MFLKFFILIAAAINDPADDFIDSHASEQCLPSSLIEGKVSAITGKVYSYDEDYVIAGQEPIRINRVCREGVWPLMPQLTATYERGYFCKIVEPNGVSYEYKKGAKFKIGVEIWTRYEFYHPTKKGRNNASSGRISGRSNHKNSYIALDSKEKFFDYHAPDGAVRHFKKTRLGNYFRLLSERLPNGNRIFYDYSQDIEERHKGYITIQNGHLIRIRTTDPSGQITYAIADFHYSDSYLLDSVTGSDGRTLSYQDFNVINSPDLPEQRLSYQRGLSRIDLPLNRYLGFGFYEHDSEIVAGQKVEMKDISYDYEYYDMNEDGERSIKHYFSPDPRRDRIKTIYAPVGSDASPMNTSSIIYFLSDNPSYPKFTGVYDIDMNCTYYYWDVDGCLTNVQKTAPDRKHFNSERFTWGEKGWLSCKSFFDENDRPLTVRHFLYDKFGNITYEMFFGNLSGCGPPPILTNKGGIVPNCCEQATKIYSYNADHLVIREQEDNGRVTRTQYLPGTDLVSAQFIGLGDQIKIRHFFEYNSQNILIRKIVDDGITFDKNDLTSVHTRKICAITPKPDAPYAGMPWIIEEKYWNGQCEALLKKIVLTYTNGARIAQKEIDDADGTFCYRLQFTYDEKGRLLTQTNALGQVETHHYDAVGNEIETREFSGRKTIRRTFDQADRLTALEEIGDDSVYISTHYSYNHKNRKVLEESSLGRSLRYSYDGFSNPTSITDGDYTTRYRTDCAGRIVEEINPDGGVTHTSYNATHHPVRIEHPDGSVETSIYNLDGTLKKESDADGVETEHAYDFLGREIGRTISFHGEILSKETSEYDAFHLIAKIDAEGNQSKYSYDGAGRLIAEVFGQEKVEYSYDTLGRQSVVKKGDLRTITKYDPLDRVIEEQNVNSADIVLTRVAYEYDSGGNRIAFIRQIDGQPSIEKYTYDSQNRLIETIDPLGHRTQTEYAPDRFQKTTTAPNGLQTILTYNSNQTLQEVEIQNSAGKILSIEKHERNFRGNLKQLTSTIFDPPRTIVTRWSYDAMGRVIELAEAAGSPEEKITRHSYTKTGLKSQTNKADGVSLSYSYTPLKTLSSLTSSDGTIRYSYTHDRLGRLTSSTDLATGYTTRRSYDPHGHLLQEALANGCTIQNSFDEHGRRTQSILPDQSSIRYGYDALSLRSIARHDEKGHILFEHEILSYDQSHRPTEEKLIAQLGTLIRHYDRDGRLSALVSPYASHQILTRDCLGNILTSRLDQAESQFAYDDLSQLQTENGPASHTYESDAHYCRLQKDEESYDVNALLQIPSHLDYDLNGNAVRSGEQKLIYDALDRLIAVETPSTGSTYVYDSEHRRIAETVCNHLTGQITTLHFLYDGEKEIGAMSDGRIVQLRTLNPYFSSETGAAIAIELDGLIFAPLHDLYGNVIRLVGLDHSVSAHQYSAYGEESPALHPNPWRYASKRTDETGLVYYGNRYYSPQLGRWLSSDPAGYTDSVNLYAFVRNNPFNLTDQFGLVAVKPEEDLIEKDTPSQPSENLPHEHSQEGLTDSKKDKLLSFDFDTPAFLETARDAFYSPHTQGAIQAIGGLCETIAGGAAILASDDFSAIIGCAAMIHGMDHFITGMKTAICGDEFNTVSSQLLQGAGLSSQSADLIDNGISLAGTMGAAGMVRANQMSNCSDFHLPRSNSSAIKVARTEPKNLSEQLTLKEAESIYGTPKSKEIMKDLINDPNYPKSEWKKMIHGHKNPDGSSIEIHYWEHRETGAKHGFKFKNG